METQLRLICVCRPEIKINTHIETSVIICLKILPINIFYGADDDILES